MKNCSTGLVEAVGFPIYLILSLFLYLTLRGIQVVILRKSNYASLRYSVAFQLPI